MARSTIDSLDPAIRAAVLAAIDRGETIDDIVELIAGMGGKASRSAVGRYTKGFAQLAAQQRDMRNVAEAFGREFGSADDHQGRMMIQLMTSITTRALMPHMTGEAEQELDTLELSRLAKAVKDATSASKIDIEREAKIREETARRERAKAAEAATTAQRRAGASEDSIALVRAAILENVA